MNEESAYKMSEAINEFGKALGTMAKSLVEILSQAFNEAWKSVKGIYTALDKQISRKRFVKILMSRGIQRNEANKIAWEVHAKYGKYTLMDCVKAISNKEE